MKILESLKYIAKNKGWYEVPADFYAMHYVTVDSHEAGMQLKHLAHHWTNLGVSTSFSFGKAQEMPIWDNCELKMIFRNVVKVEMINDRIKK